MQITRTEVVQVTSAHGQPIIRVIFDGEGGECINIDMAGSEHPMRGDATALERARAIMLQAATFDLALNEYDAQSNGNFDRVTVTGTRERDGGLYIFEYRDGDGTRGMPPSRMSSL